MNLWDENSSSEVYIPYVRVTNSYNTTRALRFDVGLCRKICLNGVIFEAETIRFIFSHVKHEIKDSISFSVRKERLKKLIEGFKEYATNLKSVDISLANAMEIIFAVAGVSVEIAFINVSILNIFESNIPTLRKFEIASVFI